MSTRLWLTAFNFSTVDSWIGSKDQIALKHALDELKALTYIESDSNAKQPTNEAGKFITAVINDGAGFGSGEETGVQILAAYALSQAARISPQPWSLAEAGDNSEQEENEEEWLWMDQVDLARQFEKIFDPSTLNFMDFFISGRCFFGTAFANNAGWYCYLTKEEVKELTDLLSRHYTDSSNLVESGALCKIEFDSRMLDILEYMLESLRKADGHDLFVFAS